MPQGVRCQVVFVLLLVCGASVAHVQTNHNTHRAWRALWGPASDRAPLAQRVTNEPTSAEIEAERERWRLIIRLLCAIIRCDSSDPSDEEWQTAGDALGVRLQRFLSDGLSSGLDSEDINDGLENVSSLLDLLSGPFADYLVGDESTQEMYITALLELEAALQQGTP